MKLVSAFIFPIGLYVYRIVKQFALSEAILTIVYHSVYGNLYT